MRPPVVTAISTGTAVVHCIIGFWRWFIRLIRLVNLEREVVLVQYSVAIVFSPSYTLSLLFYSHVSRNHNSRNHKSQHSLSVAMLLAWHPTPRTAFGIRRVRGGLDVPHCILSDRLIYYLQRWCVKRLKSRIRRGRCLPPGKLSVGQFVRSDNDEVSFMSYLDRLAEVGPVRRLGELPPQGRLGPCYLWERWIISPSPLRRSWNCP